MKTLRKIRQYTGLFPFLVIAGAFEIIPLSMIVLRSFKDPQSHMFSMQNYITIFTKQVYQQSIFNSIYVSFLSAFAGLVLAFLTGLCLQMVGKRMQNFYISFLNVVSNFAGIPLAFAFMILLGNVGIFVLLGQAYKIGWLADFDLYSKQGLTLIYIYFQIPLGTLMLLPSFTGIKKEWKESADLLNASSFQFWLYIGIPNMLSSLIGTFSILFANALTAFATVSALMGNAFLVLPIKISEMFTGELVQRQELGSALSVVMLLILVLALALCNLFKKKFVKGGINQ